jgi:uncharacterized SAM-binding protein YcdF (DUF218 family)
MTVRRLAWMQVAAAALLGASAAAFGVNAARWLKNEDAPIKADAIIVLSGPYRIEPLGEPALSTADEERTIAARFGKPGRRLIVVTSPPRVRRARLIVEQALAGTGAIVALCATAYENLPDEWWHSQAAAREVLLEWSKLAYSLLGGRFSAREGSA